MALRYSATAFKQSLKNMKNKLFCCLLFGLFSLSAFAQKYYEKALYWTDIQQANHMLQKNNGNCLMAIGFKNFITNKWQVGMLETDSLGAIQFLANTTPDGLIGTCEDITQVGNNYIVSGAVTIEPTLPWKIIITKFQEDNTYINYLYGNGIIDQDANACVNIDDIQMFVGGHIANFTINARSLYLVKLNSITAEQLWDTLYSFQQQTINSISSIATIPDGGAYLLATVNYNSENSDIALIQIDSMGVWQWHTIMNLTPTTWLSVDGSGRMIRTHDGGIVFSAKRYSVEGAYGDLFKINADHTQAWHNTENFLEGVTLGMVELSDSTLVFGGSSFLTPTTTFIDGEICKLDKDGHTLWRRRYGQSHDDDYFYDLIVNNHDPSGKSGYVLCGRTESYAPAGKAYLYLVKTNCMGLLTEPQAAFSATIDTAALTAAFQNLSDFVYPDSIDGGHYLWDFGDGTFSSEINPTHTYGQAGSYIVQLTAIVCNDTSIAYQSVCAGVSPAAIVPNFSYLIQNDSLVTFTNTSSNAVGGVFIWDFGDNTPPFVQTNPNTAVEHSYSTKDKYFVTLTAVLCGDTIRTEIKVNMLALGVMGVEAMAECCVSTLYPNPAQQTASFNHSLPQQQSGLLQIYDLTGRKISAYAFEGNGTQTIDIHYLNTGLYLYTISVEGNIVQQDKLSVIR